MNEWIKHNGGPCPVAANVNYVVQFRDGAVATIPADTMRGETNWQHRGDLDDIVAYRLASPPNADKRREYTADELPRQLAGPPPARLARDMTVRERMAMAAMQGILAAWPVNETWDTDEKARWAVDFADSLIAALGKGDE